MASRHVDGRRLIAHLLAPNTTDARSLAAVVVVDTTAVSQRRCNIRHLTDIFVDPMPHCRP
jgi:hypothetical protein